MKDEEYKTIVTTSEMKETDLEKASRRGWRVVCMLHREGVTAGIIYSFLFERRKLWWRPWSDSNV